MIIILQHHFISNMTFDSHYTYLKYYAGLGARAWLFVHSIIPPFCLPFNVFLFYIVHQIRPPHPLILRVAHYIYGRPLNLAGTHFFVVPMVGIDDIPQCDSKCFCFHCGKRRVSCFMWTNPCPSTPFPSIFLSIGSHRVIN
jgi:hypothetical protein